MFGPYWVFWYLESNNYSIVESEFKILLDIYFESSSVDEFNAKIEQIDNESHSNIIIDNIETYLHSCNTKQEQKLKLKIRPQFNVSNRSIIKQYLVKDKKVQICFDSELVQKTIHPAIAHLETDTNIETQTIFDIYLDDDFLCLFKNEKLITSVPKKDYHLLQGKFFMQLLCNLYDKEEGDWIGTFHGSTIADGNNSILIVGKSGKGKSTLCALLAANGFELVADDVSPILSEDSSIYHNPSAISVKKGAFKKLQATIDNFDHLPTTYFNKSKGLLKYIPFPDPIKNDYPCKAIIMVNYKGKSETVLEITSIKTLLETLIPDSWLSPNPLHAKQFLNWLETVSIYQLTYSNTKSVQSKLSELFRELND